MHRDDRASYKIEFPNTEFSPVELQALSPVALHLTTLNSPVLFGCRTGICATCLIEIEESDQELPLPDEEEQETLEVYAPGNPKARLACQLKLTANIKIKKIEAL